MSRGNLRHFANIGFSSGYRLSSMIAIPINGGLLQLRTNLPSKVFEGEQTLGTCYAAAAAAATFCYRLGTEIGGDFAWVDHR